MQSRRELMRRCIAVSLIVLLFAPSLPAAPQSRQASPQPTASLCVPRELVEKQSWNTPYPGISIDIFKRGILAYIAAEGDARTQYRVRSSALATFDPTRQHPRDLVDAVPATGSCPQDTYGYAVSLSGASARGASPAPAAPPTAAEVVGAMLAGATIVGGDRCAALASSPLDREKVGNGVALNAIAVADALSACREAVDKQPAQARYRYLYGRVLAAAKRHDEAAAQFEAADRAGSAMGTYYLASAYETGLGRTRNVPEAVRLYQKSAAAGQADAAARLGWLYELGVGVPKDPATGARFYAEASRARDPLGAFRLGLMYRDGAGGVPSNVETACQLFQQAAASGHVLAQGELGICYYTGRGMPRDLQTAFQWFLRSAQAGVTRAQEFVGDMYERGEGVEQSSTKAVEWYRAAAMQADPNGMFELGSHLRLGRGIAWNEAEAMQWFQKAAALGEVASMTALGMGYERGLGGGRQDYALAARWYGEAARYQALTPEQEFSVTWARVGLGSLYERGWGVRQDVDEARRLYAQAADSPNQTVSQMARQYLARVQASSRSGPALGPSKASSDLLPAIFAGGLAILTLSALLHSDSSSGSHFNWTPETSYEDQVMRRAQVGCLWNEASYINYGTCL